MALFAGRRNRRSNFRAGISAVSYTHLDVYKRQVFQQFNLFPHLSVKENIKLAPLKLKLMTKAEADKRALELLERVGLPDKADALSLIHI